ncbi:MAG: hypothetical protein HGA45_35100 [Chloroflexales bacterium]|nr:hypothetical protein [Chloroflexales bacterium]
MHSLTLPLAGGLIALAAAVNVLAYALGRPNARGTGRMIPSLQRSTSAMLALAAWALVGLGSSGRAAAPYALWVSVGMSLSFVADLIMAEVIRVPSRVLGGMLVFGMAHLAYLAGFLSLGGALGLGAGPQMLGWAAAYIIIALVYWRLAVDTPRAPRALRLGALGYLALLASMAGVAWGVAGRAPQLWSLAAGALLFFLSDAILGNQIFRQNNWCGVGDVVWATYIVGQAGIVWSVYPALLMG